MRRSHLIDAALAVGVVVMQLAIWQTMARAAHDPLDSDLYQWTWIALPAIAIALGIVRRHTDAVVWAAAMFAPWMVLVGLYGTVWFDPNDGASFWIVGEITMVIQAGWTAMWAALGAAGTRYVLGR